MNSLEQQARQQLLEAIGADQVRHNSNEDLLPHLEGTSELLREWGARQALCDAGLFHSIYGTEYFTTQILPSNRRDAISNVIGAEAEHLVWLWCFGRRLSLESEPTPRIRDRRDYSWITLDQRQFEDLINLWIADTLEQLRRMPEREIPTLEIMNAYRDHALPKAVAALDAMRLEFPASSTTSD